MKLYDKVECHKLLMHIADLQLTYSPNDPMKIYEKGIVDGLEIAYGAIQDWADKHLSEDVYMEIYKHGREDEAGLRDGTILQTFSPD